MQNSVLQDFALSMDENCIKLRDVLSLAFFRSRQSLGPMIVANVKIK